MIVATQNNEVWILFMQESIYYLEFWERICKVSMGIQRQARAGESKFLTFEKELKRPALTLMQFIFLFLIYQKLFILKSPVSWNVVAEL